jgi:type VI secretion system ImpC/EvpB family protein
VDASLLDEAVRSTVAAQSLGATIVAWLRLKKGDAPPTRDELRARLVGDVAFLDRLLTEQVNAILHHRAFQALEASWRGLDWLVDHASDAEGVKVRVLDVGWRELARDLGKAIEFDQSQLFKKVYSAEFDTPGGEPYGLLIGDYYVRHRPDESHPTDDLGALQSIAQVAEAAFAPFVAGAEPGLLGLGSFADLERPIDLERTFQLPEYVAWNALRASGEARFVGLCLPRILMRRPWRDDPQRADGFRFEEDVSTPDSHLFGNAAWALAAVVVRAVAASGWPAGIRGVPDEKTTGGVLDDLVHEPSRSDSFPRFFKPTPEMAVTDAREKELADLGLIPLCHGHGTELSAFFTCPSLQKPKEHTERAATISARLSAMLQYILCVSRFAHYLKVIARDRVGSYTSADEWERELDSWLKKYTTGNPDVSADVLARYPLKDASARVQEVAGRPGTFHCVMHLCPHFQLDQMAATVRLETDLFTNART